MCSDPKYPHCKMKRQTATEQPGDSSAAVPHAMAIDEKLELLTDEAPVTTIHCRDGFRSEADSAQRRTER